MMPPSHIAGLALEETNHFRPQLRPAISRIGDETVREECVAWAVQTRHQRLRQAVGVKFTCIQKIAVIPGESRVHVGHEYFRQLTLVKHRALFGSIAPCDRGNHDASALIGSVMEAPVLPFDSVPVHSESRSERLVDAQRAGNLARRAGGRRFVTSERLRYRWSAFVHHT